MTALPEKIVDFHVHLFPDRMFDAIWNFFAHGYKWDVIHRHYYRECIETLRSRGVGPIVYSNYAHRPGVAEGLNRWNLGVVEAFDDVYCHAAYHPGDKDALDMAADLLDHPRIMGFKLQLLVQNFYAHDPRLFPLYELVMEKGGRILFHAGTAPVGNPFVGVVHFKKVLERYPELPATVAHMGEFESRKFFALLDHHPGLYFDTAFSYLEDIGLVCPLDRDVLERHKYRILYGSDFPNLILPREKEIDYLLGMNLSDEFYRRVFLENGLDLIMTHCGG